MVGDGGTRGQHLELLLSLLLYLRKTTGTMALRLICMSATISNLDEIEQWLHAKKFYTEYVVGWLVGLCIGWLVALTRLLCCLFWLMWLGASLLFVVVVDVIRSQFSAQKVWHVFQIRRLSKRQVHPLRAQSTAGKEPQPHSSRHARFVLFAGCRHSKSTARSERTGVPTGESIEPCSQFGLGHGEPRWKR